MKIHVVGFEISQGVSKKSGQPYSIGKLHAVLPISGSAGAKGYMGSEYRCEPPVLQTIDGLPLPFMAEVEFQDVMRYGKREQQVVSIKPTNGKVEGVK